MITLNVKLLNFKILFQEESIVLAKLPWNACKSLSKTENKFYLQCIEFQLKSVDKGEGQIFGSKLVLNYRVKV